MYAMNIDRPTRRRMLQIGGISYLGLSLPRLLKANASPPADAPPRRADACVLIFLNGGPSHLDMWDMKPDAPAEVRGEFRPVGTTVPGIQLSEHLPRLARHMHHCALVRSVRHTVNNAHAAAVYTSLTGHDRGDANRIIPAGPDDYPAIGAVLSRQHPPTTSVVPFVHMPYVTQEGRGGPPQPGFFGGWMGRNHDPFFVLRDPNAADFGMPELTPLPELAGRRLHARRDLLGVVDRTSPGDVDGFRSQAYDLLTSEATQQAFRVDREPQSIREAYGRNIYGQSALLARRLIEAGARMACISWAPDANATWDTHGQNFTKLRGELLPQLDRAVAGLINDLETRGLLERTLVVVMGEFGRTPRVNAGAGRDHWNFCYSVMLAGGGIKGGHVYGASDRVGAYPSRNPVGPADVVATIYHCLGISADMEMRDRLNRPFSLVPWGAPILDLVT
jgi:hypothetical protein